MRKHLISIEMNKDSVENQLAEIRTDIQMLKDSMSLLCGWISKQFGVEFPLINAVKTAVPEANAPTNFLQVQQETNINISTAHNLTANVSVSNSNQQTVSQPQSPEKYKNESTQTQQNDPATIPVIFQDDDLQQHFLSQLLSPVENVTPTENVFDINASSSATSTTPTIKKKRVRKKSPTDKPKEKSSSKKKPPLSPKPEEILDIIPETVKEEVAKNVIRKVPEMIQCEVCGKFLNGHLAMKRHTQTHNELRPHSCHICQKSFQRKFHLKTHLMIHTGEKKHQCGFCGRLFLLTKDLQCHERTHTGEKPFGCTHCPRRFNLKSHLTMHIRIHTGEKPYKCESCEKCFSQPNSLRVHKKVHAKPHEEVQVVEDTAPQQNGNETCQIIFDTNDEQLTSQNQPLQNSFPEQPFVTAANVNSGERSYITILEPGSTDYYLNPNSINTLNFQNVTGHSGQNSIFMISKDSVNK